MGPYGWPDVNKNNAYKEQPLISDSDFCLGLCQGDLYSGLCQGDFFPERERTLKIQNSKFPRTKKKPGARIYGIRGSPVPQFKACTQACAWGAPIQAVRPIGCRHGFPVQSVNSKTNER